MKSHEAAMPTSQPENSAYLSHLLAGCSISQLAVMFGRDKRTVSEKLRFCEPSGERRGHPIYSLAEASHYLMRPLVDADAVEAYIRKVGPEGVSPYLLKEFWTGQLAKQRFENTDAQLWPTPDVKAMFLDEYEKVRHGIRTFAGISRRRPNLHPSNAS